MKTEDCFPVEVSKWMTTKTRIPGQFDSMFSSGKHISLTAPSLSDVWIVLVGVAGSGKSSFISQVVEGVTTTVDSPQGSCALYLSFPCFALFLIAF